MAERRVKVSVLIPSFNYARYLPQAIESVLGQSHGDFELLISDDASRDGFEEIIRSCASHDGRIRFQPLSRSGDGEQLELVSSPSTRAHSKIEVSQSLTRNISAF